MLENTEGLIQKDNPEKQATYDTQDTGQIHVGEYRRGNKKGQSRETGNIGCTRSRQTKQNHNTMCWTLLFASRHTFNDATAEAMKVVFRKHLLAQTMPKNLILFLS
jgi:hypothetical protein